jgi:hypothetical protein
MACVACSILHEYELKVQNGPYKYKKASEFMMNTCIIGIKKHVAGIITAKEAAEKKVTALEQQLNQVRHQAGCKWLVVWGCGRA